MMTGEDFRCYLESHPRAAWRYFARSSTGSGMQISEGSIPGHDDTVRRLAQLLG